MRVNGLFFSMSSRDVSAPSYMTYMRRRLMLCLVGFACAGMIVVWRLLDVMVFVPSKPVTDDKTHVVRGNIYDRNGVLLAVSLPTTSAYVHPHEIHDDQARAVLARDVATILPHIDSERLYHRLMGEEKFIWLERNMTPKTHQQ